MAITRWTDDRLDDMRGTVMANDHRLDTVQDLAQTNDRRITDLEKANALHTVNWQYRLMLIATIASPVCTLGIVLWKG